MRAMVVALKETKIRGEIRTNVDYAVDMLQARRPPSANRLCCTGASALR